MSALPPTEGRQSESAGLDLLDTRELVDLLVRDQAQAAAAVRTQTSVLASAVEGIVARIRAGGRLHYIGSGTSGRLAVLDASEMPPTFGTSPDLVCAHIAGGDSALRTAIEGAEDDAGAGEAAIEGHVTSGDAVVGVSASGGARYVVAALERARVIGALTVAITSSDNSALVSAAQLAIVLPTGAEALSGSTRLKAGTAQKITLNTLSTAIMVRLGKVHDNLMVDVVATNDKLRGRAARLVRDLTGADETRVRAALDACGGNVKVASVMIARGVDANRARAMLQSETLRSLL
ncbi:MAG TPA: N-acetylmuramic acid 6-phosphate etherase [Verrucomicrobiae bacterium]|nr:N-acetylmuramic acid 6-phosphate etherase [Verrucomicrobiae bacterium]